MEKRRLKILKDLSYIVSDVVGVDDLQLTMEMTANDVENWDSMSHVRILFECEQKWGMRLSINEISNLNNIGDLIYLIEKNY